MRLPRFSLQNSQFTIVIIALLVLSGAVSLITMPRSEDPQVSNSGSSIYILYPGADPADLEQLVIDPLEEAINELEDIKKINSWMEDGLAVMHIEFLTGTDPDDKYSDVLQKVNATRPTLPDDIYRLMTEKWAISNVNIMQIALLSESSNYREMQLEAERLEKLIEKIGDIKFVQTWAFPEEEIRVAVDLEKSAAMFVPLSQIIGAIKSSNQNIPGGYIDAGDKRFNIQTSGSLKTIEELQSTVVGVFDGVPVFLKDVADVFFTSADNNYFARFNGKRCVFITASQKERTNIFTIQEQIDETLAKFSSELPSSMSIEGVFEQSRSVAHRLNNFFTNLVQGLILVCLVVLIGVGFRASVIVMLAIPTSIFIGLGLIDMSGFGIEQMSIAGFVIALGLLVDNAIVVTENISRFLHQGLSHREAAIRGTEEIGWAIVSATATTVLAFVPIITMQNITGEFIRSMPVTVVYTLLASLFIALTLTPYLSSKLLRRNNQKGTNPLKKVIDLFIHRYYRGFLRFSLSHRLLIVGLSLVIFFSSLLLYPLIGVSFFPKAEKPQFVINIDLPEGSNLMKTDETVRHIESILSQKKEIKHFASNIGRGNPRIYYNVIPSRQKSTHAQIYVELHQFSETMMARLTSELRDNFRNFPGAQIDVKILEQGPPVEAPIAIKIIGEDLNILRKLAQDVEEIIRQEPGTVNINNPLGTSKTDLELVIDRAKASLLGLPIHEIDRTIRTAIAGAPISKFRNENGEEFDIIVRLPFENSLTLSDLNKIYVTAVTGQQYPLRQFARLEFKGSPMQIHHYNLDRNVTLTSDVVGDLSVDRTTQNILKKLDTFDWPKGYRYYVAGELEKREESFGGMVHAVLIAIIAIFGILVLQFRSFMQPLVVFSAIPLAIIGSLLALYLTGNSFSFMAFIGIASLVGIVINNSIILVDYTNQLRAQNKTMHEALQLAGETRFLPIILTTITTIGGLLPLTLQGGSVWAPMGWTIIGGLATSTFLTLIVVPVLYSLFIKEF